MDDDLLGGLDGAGALRSGGVLARQCGAGLSGCALAGAGPCGGGGVFHMPVQPVLEKAGGLSAPRLRYPAAGKKPGHRLRLGAQHRPGGPAAPPADAGPAAGRAGGYVHHSVHRRGNDAGRGGPHGHAAGL